ncbi:related to cycloheximide-inducible protein CIP70 (cytochrome P450 family) [Phialocephala subalpina]|uniref:Related to cycloheximide-inducible protein CIP70 (Cytochrome P450 family) n=1 Tax=Phialocephala subalpina TaxID=576137 RepID=A0A1L7XWU3_9HELO|nr:related to cycloheximide-inducible protein CIP70 (cytochrome P450 family) [Phialocephala subalpina]
MTTRDATIWLKSYLDTSLLKGGPLVLVVAVAILAGFLYSNYEAPPDISHIPVLGAELDVKTRRQAYTYNARTFLERGYNEFNKLGKAFQLDTADGPKIVLNVKQSEEVSAKPDNIVDNMRPNGRGVQDKYTGYMDGDDVIFRIIKTQLSTRLGELGDILAHQTDKSLAAYIPPCNEWTPVVFYDSITRVVAAVSTRIFVGEELTTSEEWLQITIDYTKQLMEAAHAIKFLNPWLRPIFYRFLPQFRTLMNTNEAALRIVKPLVQARREAMDKPDFNGGDNMLQWMLDERVKKGFHDKDYRYLAQLQLQLSFAAIHTTSMALTNMLYDLIANPEMIGILHEEVKEQLALNNGSWEGQFLKKLQKVDSFMKESQRHNPVGLTISDRDILRPITLSDGTFLPAGTTITSNGWHINRDPDVLQSESDPKKFDGLRYYNMRDQLIKTGLDDKKVAGKHQFVSISSSSMMFGTGKHACPGRFFAGNEIKLLLAKIVMRFDLKMPPGVTERYPGFSYEQSNLLDTTKNIMMKRRKL